MSHKLKISKAYTVRASPNFFEMLQEYAMLKDISISKLIQFCVLEKNQEYLRLKNRALEKLVPHTDNKFSDERLNQDY